jgi:RNA 2',3'-cyclic 3'-phosphodiesterase
MQQIRTFLAIPLSIDLSRAMSRLIEEIQSAGDGIKWIPKDNIHLTLKFLGDVDNVEIPQVCDVASDCAASIEPFNIVVHGTGGLPSGERARVIHAGLQEPTGSLIKLVQSLELGFADMGFKPEPRDYVPHLTIGRTRGGSRRASPEVMEKIAEYSDHFFGEMSVDEIRVYATFLDKSGPTYQVMDTIPLGE